jgi:sodium transport system ATP-binding protein
LTAREILEYFGRLHGLDEAQLQARVEELLDTFTIRPFADGRCESLSTGQRQRVSIARAVLHDPPVLILDEPTTGLDILAASDMIDFIQSRKEAGTCVLFSTHILSEAERLCDRIGVIDQGRLLAVGSLEELRAQTGKEWLEDVFRALVQDAGTEAPAATPPANEG